MKALLYIVVAIATTATLLAQSVGTMTFNNRQVTTDGITANRPTTLVVGAPGRSLNGNANSLYSIGLFVKMGDGSYVLARNGDGTGVGQHRDDSTGPGGGPSGTMQNAITLTFDANNRVGFRAAGTSITFQLRVWETAAGSFDAAFWRGIALNASGGADFVSAPLGDIGGTIPTPNLNNLGFTGIQASLVPEPSTFALGTAGCVALAFLRRRT
jgi:hypothetical protein